MASNQLSEATKGSIENSIDSLFGRVVTAMPFPLTTIVDRKLLVEGNFPQDIRRALSLIRGEPDDRWGRVLEGCTYIRHRVLLPDLSSEPVTLLLQTYDAEDRDHEQRFLDLPYDMLAEMPPATEEDIHRALPPDKAVALLDWLRQTYPQAARAKDGFECLKEIIAIARTPGQLRRMVPDMVHYLPTHVQRQLDDQKRASSLPFEWSKFDRERLDRALSILATCYLLPDSAALSNRAWSSRNNQRTWIEI